MLITCDKPKGCGRTFKMPQIQTRETGEGTEVFFKCPFCSTEYSGGILPKDHPQSKKDE